MAPICCASTIPPYLTVSYRIGWRCKIANRRIVVWNEQLAIRILQSYSPYAIVLVAPDEGEPSLQSLHFHPLTSPRKNPARLSPWLRFPKSSRTLPRAFKDYMPRVDAAQGCLALCTLKLSTVVHKVRSEECTTRGESVGRCAKAHRASHPSRHAGRRRSIVECQLRSGAAFENDCWGGVDGCTRNGPSVSG